jgi:hypothetical protein
MADRNFYDAYGFSPGTRPLAGGLVGLLQDATRQRGADLEAASNPGTGQTSESYGNPEGLLGRLLALQAEQNNPAIPNAGQRQSEPRDSNFRQLSRVAGAALPQETESSAPPAPASALPPPSGDFEADQAQQAREVAAADLARKFRSPSRANAPPPDPVDIAKSAGIGLANGAVGTAGFFAGDIPTGFGFFPKNLVANRVMRLAGYPELGADQPDWVRDHFTANPIRQAIEDHLPFGKFYQPETRTGRFAETIGEFAPLILGGWASRGAAALTKGALRTLGTNLLRDAVAPGVAVQGLEEAYPESHAGKTLQKAYPAIRRGLPLALAVKRHLTP